MHCLLWHTSASTALQTDFCQLSLTPSAHATQARCPAAAPARWVVRAAHAPRCARCAALQRSLLHAPRQRRAAPAQRPRRPLAAAPLAAAAHAAPADSHGQGTLQQGDHEDAYDASNALHRALARVFGRLGLMQLAEALEHDTRVSVALVVLIAVAGVASLAAGMPAGQHAGVWSWQLLARQVLLQACPQVSIMQACGLWVFYFLVAAVHVQQQTCSAPSKYAHVRTGVSSMSLYISVSHAHVMECACGVSCASLARHGTAGQAASMISPVHEPSPLALPGGLLPMRCAWPRRVAGARRGAAGAARGGGGDGGRVLPGGAAGGAGPVLRADRGAH